MLAASLVGPSDTEGFLDEQLHGLKFPVIASPKLDGIRCILMPWVVPSPFQSVAACRSLKMVPNTCVQQMLAMLPPGLDGEILTYDQGTLWERRNVPRTFHKIQSDIMCEGGQPLFRYHIFDDVNMGNPNQRYEDRLMVLADEDLPDWCIKIEQRKIRNIEELQSFMGECLAAGHEGICFRDPWSPYKFGRSTFRQQWLVKWKMFHTSEAIIVGVEELMRNENVPALSPTGYQERSSHQSGMVPGGTLGSLVVRQEVSGTPNPGIPMIEFKIGTGFTAQLRQELWARREELPGKIVTFRHQPHGAKDAPRIPVFVGIRDERDL